MTRRTIISSTDDFAYRITYEAIRRGPRSPVGFYPDMDYEIYDVEIGASKTTTDWLLVDCKFIGSTQWAWIEEQVAEDVAETCED